jgi:polyisoprenoid-binding protein YceI
MDTLFDSLFTPTRQACPSLFSATAKPKRSDFGVKTHIPRMAEEVSLIMQIEGNR